MCAVTIVIIIVVINIIFIIIIIVIIHHTGHLTKVQLKTKRPKKKNKAMQTLSLPKSILLYRKNLDLNLCKKKKYT